MAVLKTAMLQRTATAEAEHSPSDPSIALESLGRGWLVLRNCRLGPPQGRVRLSALIHPGVGVVLLDILPATTPGAVEAFRGRLEAARFRSIFPGDLPVVHLRLAPQQLGGLREQLEGAFASQPPLSLPGGDAWVVAVARALSTEPAVPRLRSRRFRARQHRRFFLVWRVLGAAGLVAGLLAVMLAANGDHRPNPPTAETAAAASPPASVAGEVVMPESQKTAVPPVKPPDAVPALEDLAAVQPTAPPTAAVQALTPTASALPAPSMPDAAATVPQEPELSPFGHPPAGPISKDRASRSEMTNIGARVATPVPRPAPPKRRPEPETSLPEREDPHAMPISPSSSPWHGGAPEPTRRPPIAGPVLPPIAGPAAANRSEAPLQHCRRIVYLVGQGVLLPEEELQFFQQACVRR